MQEFQEQHAVEDFRQIKYYFEVFCETQEQLGMSGYLISARNYPYGYFYDKELQGSGTRDS